AAAQALSQIGPGAAAAVPFLEAGLDDFAEVRELLRRLDALSPGDRDNLRSIEGELYTRKARHDAIVHALGSIGPASAETAPAVLRAIAKGDVSPETAGALARMGVGSETAREMANALTFGISPWRAARALAALGPE